MAAVPLSDDGMSVTYQLDDGSTVKVAKDAATRLGAPMPPPVAPTPVAPPQLDAIGPSIAPPPLDNALAGAPGAGQFMAPRPTPPNPALGALNSDAAGGATGGAQPPSKQPQQMTPEQRHAQGDYGDVTGAINGAYGQVEQANADKAIAEHAASIKNEHEIAHRNAALDETDRKEAAFQQQTLGEMSRLHGNVNAAMDRFNSATIDPNRLSKSMSTAGKAGLLFFQVVAGLGQALEHQGDKNPAIDMWMKAIDDDIRLQMDDRSHKRDQIGVARDALSSFKDMASSQAATFSLAKAATIGRYQRALEGINAQTKSETVKANTAEANARLEIEKQNAVGEWFKTETANKLALRKQKEDERQARTNEGIAGGHLALARQEFGEGIRRFDLEYAQRERLHQDDLNEKIALAKASGKTVEAKQLEEDRKFAVGAPTAVAKDKDGNIVRNEDGTPQVLRQDLTNSDGTTWHARNEEQAKEFGNKIAVAGEVTDILNEVQAIRDEVGSSKLALSALSPIPTDAQARLKVLQNRLVVLAKSGTQGMSSDEDMKKLSATLGATDLASFTTNARGIEEAKARTISQLNREARNTYRYDGAIKFDDVQTLGANPADKSYEALAKGKTREQLGEDATPGKARRAAEYLTGGGLFYKSSNEKAEAAASGEQTSSYGITPDAQKGLDEMTQQLRSPDRGTAANAAAKLINAAKEHPELATAIAGTVRDQAPEVWNVVKGKLPADAVKAADARGNAPAFSEVTDFAPADVARQALQNNAEGRRIARSVMDASKSKDPAVRKAAQKVIDEANRIQKGQ
jgi:hypothetical protein